jgi:GH24 family phage-related lysozyme (muramidase)
MTPEGENLLIEHEGEILSAYQDSLGYWTIGVGHLIDKRRGGGITQKISRLLLEDDIAHATASARASFDWIDQLDPVRQDVIVMLTFNMGVGGRRPRGNYRIRLGELRSATSGEKNYATPWNMGTGSHAGAQWMRRIRAG